jgi:glycosyltransferase involved in cell wall biosynthesis
MRILHLIPQFSAGGAERQLSFLASEMSKMGHEVHIAYLRQGPESVTIPGVILHRLDVSRNHDPMLFLQLLRVIRTIQPHIIQSWILMMDIAVGLISLIKNVTWVLREPTSQAAYQNSGLKQKLRARLVHRASAIVSNSPGGRSYWLGQGIPEQRLSIIPNAVPFEVINSVKPLQDEGETRKILLYAGRLMPSKNVDVVINAVAGVQHRQNVLLYIAGDGPSKTDLISLVARLNLSETVRFVGFLKSGDLWARMKAADAFISLSDYEGMPNCVCEAIACGIPLILSDIPGHRTFLDDDSALLIPVDSVTEVTRSIWDTINNKKEAAQRSARAAEAIKNWTVEGITAKYIDLYAELLADERVP